MANAAKKAGKWNDATVSAVTVSRVKYDNPNVASCACMRADSCAKAGADRHNTVMGWGAPATGGVAEADAADEDNARLFRAATAAKHGDATVKETAVCIRGLSQPPRTATRRDTNDKAIF